MYRSFAVVTFAMIAISVVAQSPDWTLGGVKLGDGTSVTGHFDYDGHTGMLSNWSITVSDHGLFTAFTYTPANSTGGPSFSGADFQFMATDSLRVLRLRTIYPLPACGNVQIPLLLTDDASSGECVFPCDTAESIRVVTAGALGHFEIPDDCFEVPAISAPALALLATALILIALSALRS